MELPRAQPPCPLPTGGAAPARRPELSTTDARQPGTLVLVATPIGNLGDLAPRAARALASADVVACEDTRHTRKLLTHAAISGKRLVALHEHNEASQIPVLLAELVGGASLALVSDAGTPLVSDPGARLVSAAVAAGIEVGVVPGPCAAVAALVVSGLPADRWCFEGFLPRTGRERSNRLAALAAERRTTVLYESPHRVAATLTALASACGPSRRVAVVRELTKLHEEVWRGTLGEAAAVRAEGAPPRGEHTIVLAGAPEPAGLPDEELEACIEEAVAAELAAGRPVREAAALAGAEFGVPRRRAYEAALRVRGRLA
ncbi:MAG: 16S rRNA (cytidine(1402)-2'-O)-methyltransferase [Acidimicrobiales bacterium]